MRTVETNVTLHCKCDKCFQVFSFTDLDIPEAEVKIFCPICKEEIKVLKETE